MNQQNPARRFLSHFFQLLNERKITYCVLRNYEDLPEKVGNDIDIWIRKGEQKRFQKCLVESARENNWRLIRYSARPNLKGEGDYFYSNDENDLAIIHFDCWSYLYWRGLSYIDEDRFLSNLILDNNGFWRPAEGIEASILLLKDLLYHKKVPDKYKKRIYDLSGRDRENFVHAIEKPFGVKISNDIVKSVNRTEWEALEKNAKTFRSVLIRRAVLTAPFSQIKNWIIYLYSHLRKYLFSHNGFFLVLIGPDGSGKSTTANNILTSEIKRLFQKKQSFHGHFAFLPELKQVIGFLKKDSKSFTFDTLSDAAEEVTRQFGVLRAMIYPLYYGLEYFLGHFLLWIEKARGGLILFDRYFYDYFLQKPYRNCPQWLLFLIYKMIPKPDILIFLKNDPETIHSRKPELPVEEIARQSNICHEIVRRAKNGVVIETSVSEDEVVKRIQRIIVEKIRQKAKQF